MVTGVKSGIIPRSAFANGQASVTFAVPYATADYLVLLTAVSSSRFTTFSPALLAHDPTGFTVSRGGGLPSKLVEVHWMTQPIGDSQ